MFCDDIDFDIFWLRVSVTAGINAGCNNVRNAVGNENYIIIRARYWRVVSTQRAGVSIGWNFYYFLEKLVLSIGKVTLLYPSIDNGSEKYQISNTNMRTWPRILE